MPLFHPFKAWLPRHPSQACLPLGSYSQKTIDSLRQKYPQSFLNVVFPSGTTKSRPDWHLSRLAWENFKNSKSYRPTGKNVFGVYVQEHQGQCFTGLIGTASTADFEALRIKKHEDTLRKKEKTLFEYLNILRIQAEPVYLLFEDDSTWQRLVKAALQRPAFLQFKDNLDRNHTLTLCDDEQLISEFVDYFESLDAFYVADGHHRCAASALYGRQHGHKGTAGLIMSTLLPMSGVKPDPFSRLIRHYQGEPDAMEILRKAAVHFLVAGPAERPDATAFAALCLEGQWYSLQPRLEPERLFGLLGKVPSFILNELVFKPVFEISDFRGDQRLRYVGGKPDHVALRQEVLSGKALAALAMQPVSIQHFKEISDAHLSMPPKSTWFLPKFLTGLTVFEYDN